MQESVILVDEHDCEIGFEEKLKAHRDALLHRAFSVIVYRKIDEDIEILLQQRHFDKYHCGGLWSNTCCSHPRPFEVTLAGAERRLQEEMGLRLPLQSVGHFIYQVLFDNGLSEHEYDHVFIGEYDGTPVSFDPIEVSDYCWQPLPELLQDLEEHPKKYTPWLWPALTLAKSFFK